MQKTGGIKRGLTFVYISLIVHGYALLVLSLALDRDILDMLAHPEKYQNRETVIENIIVDTRTESRTVPDSGKISDRPNIDSGNPGAKNTYNFLNPFLDDVLREGSPLSTGKPSELVKKQEKTSTEPAREKTDKSSAEQESAGVKPSDPRPSFFDPERKPDVTMDTLGDISLATVPREFADYFLAMQRKIGAQWKEFFPVFQYYQGILKSGEVMVNFQVDLDGNVRNARVTRSYGYSILDQSSLNAVNYSRNFGPLPQGLRDQGSININFKFIYIGK